MLTPAPLEQHPPVISNTPVVALMMSETIAVRTPVRRDGPPGSAAWHLADEGGRHVRRHPAADAGGLLQFAVSPERALAIDGDGLRDRDRLGGRIVTFFDDVGESHRSDGHLEPFGAVVDRHHLADTAIGQEHDAAEPQVADAGRMGVDGPGEAVSSDRPHRVRATLHQHDVRLERGALIRRSGASP